MIMDPLDPTDPDLTAGTYLIKIVITLKTNGRIRVKWSGIIVQALTRKRDGAVLEFSLMSDMAAWAVGAFVNVL